MTTNSRTLFTRADAAVLAIIAVIITVNCCSCRGTGIRMPGSAA